MIRFTTLLVLVTIGCTALAWCIWPSDTGTVDAAPPLPLAAMTTREGLDGDARAARRRLDANPSDAPAAIRLAGVLLRKARVDGDARHAMEAEQVLKALLKREPSEYTALKMLGAVYLAQHRFQEAREFAHKAMAVDKTDAWSYGVLGDACLELGDYDRAFEAFDAMVRLRPDAAAYARVAYAHELQGRVGEALRYMRMAADATGAHDPESLAWHYAQIANLHFRLGDLDSAAREYARADHMFPRHPYARVGLARVTAARGNIGGALALYRALMESAPSPEIASAIGDLLHTSGQAAAAGEMYERAEQLEREGWKTEAPQPAALARMLAERGLKTQDAVLLAEEAAASRSDIFTMDALAWAYFRAGRFGEARAASLRARRTGTSDRRILYHAAAIEHALGNDAEARRLSARAVDHPAFDPLIGAAAVDLANRLGPALAPLGRP